jgi:hypothetical protein
MKSAALALVLLAATWSGQSYAETGAATPASTPLEARDGVLVGGLVTFGAAYWAALYVGGTSDLTPDHLMLIPLAGPWLSLAERAPCGGERAPSCGSDATFRTLMVVDGVAQAAGALIVLAAFLMPRRNPAPAPGPTPLTPSLFHVSLTPARTGSGWGLAAAAHF